MPIVSIHLYIINKSDWTIEYARDIIAELKAEVRECDSRNEYSGGTNARDSLEFVENKLTELHNLSFIAANETGIARTPARRRGAVTFSFKDPGALLVELAGSFNADWSPEAMKDRDGDGTWELVKFLEPGAWQYKFIVDGSWATDPTNPKKVSDGFGGHNSLLEVTP